MGDSDIDPGDLSDDLPPLVGEDGVEVPPEEPPAATPEVRRPPESEWNRPAGHPDRRDDDDDDDDEGIEQPQGLELPEGMTEEQALHAAALLHQKRREQEASAEPTSEFDALRGAMLETDGPRSASQDLTEATKRLLSAIAKDDFEDCEVALMQGADPKADCGAGMMPIHLSSLRANLQITELLLKHGSKVNERDASGNSPLLYGCHFYRQHGRGPQILAQLLHHRADPFYRVKDGKMAGTCALDIAEQACREPQQDENGPRQMRAMLQLAMDGSEDAIDSINKMWMSFKSADMKLFNVSAKGDSYNYALRSVEWSTPVGARNALPSQPLKLETDGASILEEKYTYLKDYSFSDEGDKVKVYVSFPDSAVAALKDSIALTVDFEFQAFDLKLSTASECFRLRIDPLFGTIEAAAGKHRASPSSKRVSITLVKRHKNRQWKTLLKVQ